MIDEIDKSLLSELIKDAEKPYLQLAKDLNLSNSLVHQRMTKLKQSGVFQGVEAKINQKLLGYEITAYCFLEIDPSTKSMDLLKAISEVVECSFISGEYNVFIRVLARDNDHLREVLNDKLNSIKQIKRIQTNVSFGAVFKKSALI